MRMLVIPEDFRNDQYILKPLFERLVRSSRRRAQVLVCQDPLLGGVARALNSEQLAEVVTRYDAMINIFVLCVDRDGVEGRRVRLDAIEQEFGSGRVFLAENAWEEIETWALAGLSLPAKWRWADVRTQVQVKETYFEPLVKDRQLDRTAGRGRQPLGAEAARHVSAIRQKCPEFDCLARRLDRFLARTATAGQ